MSKCKLRRIRLDIHDELGDEFDLTSSQEYLFCLADHGEEDCPQAAEGEAGNISEEDFKFLIENVQDILTAPKGSPA